MANIFGPSFLLIDLGQEFQASYGMKLKQMMIYLLLVLKSGNLGMQVSGLHQADI